jgi:ParB-like chromosome segregation protein Spo0J
MSKGNMLATVSLDDDETTPSPAPSRVERHDKWVDNAKNKPLEIVGPTKQSTVDVVEGLPIYAPGMSVSVPSLMLIPVELVDRSPNNARRFQLQSELSALRDAIARDGQQVAIQAVFNPDTGRFAAKDGQRRLWCLKDIGVKFIKAELVEGKAAHLEWRDSRELNTMHAEQTLLDDIAIIKQMFEGSGQTQMAFAATMRLTVSQLSKLLTMAELPAELIEMMGPYPLVFHEEMVYQLALIHKEKGEQSARELILRGVGGEKFTVRKIRAIKDALFENRTEAAIHTGRRHYVIKETFKGRLTGDMKVWDDKIHLVVGKIDPAVREEFADKLKQLCDSYAAPPKRSSKS